MIFVVDSLALFLQAATAYAKGSREYASYLSEQVGYYLRTCFSFSLLQCLCFHSLTFC